MVNTNKIRYLVLVSLVMASAFSLTGCGGNGGGSSTPSPNGIYNGTITGGLGTPPNGDEKGIIYNGRIMVFSTVFDIQNFFDSQLIISNTSFNGALNIYSNKSSKLGVSELSGTFVENTSFTATFTNSTNVNISSGTINLTANIPLYNRGSSTQSVAGSWQGTHGNLGDATTLAIDASGTITTGSDLEGCNFTGSVIPADTNVNVYNVIINSTGGTGCTSLPASTYTGLAWTEGANDTILNLTVADGAYSRSVVLTKN